MTSMAFSLGVLPLVLSSDAGSGGRTAIGSGVLSGTIAATVLGVLFVPFFFVMIARMTRNRGSEREDEVAVDNSCQCLFSFPSLRGQLTIGSASSAIVLQAGLGYEIDKQFRLVTATWKNQKHCRTTPAKCSKLRISVSLAIETSMHTVDLKSEFTWAFHRNFTLAVDIFS